MKLGEEQIQGKLNERIIEEETTCLPNCILLLVHLLCLSSIFFYYFFSINTLRPLLLPHLHGVVIPHSIFGPF